MLSSALFILGTYLWASIPTAYVVARYLKGIDIRQYGSGNVGAANVMAHVGRRIGFGLGTFDCVVKGTLPVVLANVFGEPLYVQAGVSLVAIAGHCWSLYIGFTGGRGVATAVGVVLGFLMWPEFLILCVVMGLLGYVVFREMGFWTFIAMLALPLLAFVFDRPTEVLVMTLGVGGVLTAKRLTANWEMPSGEYPLVKVIGYRVIWDRDVPKRVQWTRRSPR